MKRLFFYICFLNITISSMATGQDSEVLYIDGEKWQLLGRPINSDAALVNRLIDVLPENRIKSTANWDGFTACWSINSDEMLCLDSIQVWMDSREESHVCLSAEDMHKVFNEYYDNGVIIASWYNGDIRVARGKRLYYEHTGYFRNYEQEQVFKVKNGRITDRETFQNKVVVDGFSLEGLKLVKQGNVLAFLKTDHSTQPKQQLVKAIIPISIEDLPRDGRIILNVNKIQVDSIGHLVNCEVSVSFRAGGGSLDDDIKARLAQDIKTQLMQIYPWKVLYINEKYYPDLRSVSVPILISEQ
ncbi:MAG: hypothetical protein IKW85_05785 [Muribaculaceae bacterium]|nr:hypothetical protein [Muribaculaceae bacterium]